MNIAWLIIGGAAAAAAFGRRGGGGTGGGTGGGGDTPKDERGFRFTGGCRDLEVQDEATALAWARKFTANVAGDWVMPFIQATVGSCLVPLSADKATAEAIAQKHIAFLWRMCLHAIRGAVDGGKLTLVDAQKRIADAVELAKAQGIDPGVLTPQVLPP